MFKLLQKLIDRIAMHSTFYKEDYIKLLKREKLQESFRDKLQVLLDFRNDAFALKAVREIMEKGYYNKILKAGDYAYITSNENDKIVVEREINLRQIKTKLDTKLYHGEVILLKDLLKQLDKKPEIGNIIIHSRLWSYDLLRLNLILDEIASILENEVNKKNDNT